MKIRHHIFAVAASAILATGAYAADIKLGVSGPFTGGSSSMGVSMRDGVRLAAKEINAAGGINGRKINLIYEDEEANPAVATQKAEKLFQVEKVDFLTGTVNSGSTLAVGQLAERNGKLIATTVSFADSITGDKCSPNVFRVNARAGMQSAALAAWVEKEIPKANIFFIGPDYEMGRSTVSAFKKASTEKGAKDVGEVFAPLDNKDYSPYFGQVRSAKPNVIYTSVAGNDTVRLFTQMDEYGVNKGITIVGASGTVTSQNMGAIGKSANGFVTGVGYSPKLDNPANKKFVSDFQKAYNKLPDLYGADSYGLLYFYKAAVEKAKSTDTDKVRVAMNDLSWQTPQGVKKMRAGDHQAMQDMFAVRVENGEFNIVGRVPADQAIGADVCSRF